MSCIAILTENGFEETQLINSKKAMEQAGIAVHIVSPRKDSVKGWKNNDWNIRLSVDITLDEALAKEYDGIIIPGGIMHTDLMRLNHKCVEFVQHFFNERKLIAAICHGPQLLIESGNIKGLQLTSSPAIKTDLINAGAIWMDRELMIDNNLITAQSSGDLEIFNHKLLEYILDKQLYLN